MTNYVVNGIISSVAAQKWSTNKREKSRTLLSKRKINTVIKNVRKLSKLEGNAVVAKSVDGKIVYSNLQFM